MTTSCPPVLYLIFNRPNLMKQSFESIRRAQPNQLFIAADGPRVDRPDDVEKCAAAREIVNQVDWPCEVKTLFREENLGCKIAVSSAIDWFFENLEEGIILEDDCVANESFFRFCAELLDRYRDVERVMMVSGNNFQNGRVRGDGSYYWSCFTHIWGWATWRRAWTDFDVEMLSWPDFRDEGGIEALWENVKFVEYWTRILEKAYAGRIDTWDHPWLYHAWLHRGLTALPQVNMVSNIGFGADATHTRGSGGFDARRPTSAMDFPLNHPPDIRRCNEADIFTQQHKFGRKASKKPSFALRAKRKAQRYLRALTAKS